MARVWPRAEQVLDPRVECRAAFVHDNHAFDVRIFTFQASHER